MVVDDEESIRGIFSAFLTRLGHEVAVAETGPLALAQLELFRPHLVLLDIWMPGMNGIEVLKKIKDLHPEMPVIMVTAEMDEEIGRSAVESGAADYLTKPITLGQLNTYLTVHLIMESDE
ncbi:MAG: response regulator [Candidatus Latescibacteria bacterium]|jgi:DNA-binding response OmpR family regulator|nr:response regulator [Candidatus Latescibacterota bacterium]